MKGKLSSWGQIVRESQRFVVIGRMSQWTGFHSQCGEQWRNSFSFLLSVYKLSGSVIGTLQVQTHLILNNLQNENLQNWATWTHPANKRQFLTLNPIVFTKPHFISVLEADCPWWHFSGEVVSLGGTVTSSNFRMRHLPGLGSLGLP